jgi:hypothetical protein
MDGKKKLHHSGNVLILRCQFQDNPYSQRSLRNLSALRVENYFKRGGR